MELIAEPEELVAEPEESIAVAELVTEPEELVAELEESTPVAIEPGNGEVEEMATRRRALPVRTCAGCGRKAPQTELVRFAAVDGRLTEGRELHGRGVYTCRRLACFERAATQNAFSRVLRRKVAIEPGLDSLYTGTSGIGNSEIGVSRTGTSKTGKHMEIGI